jgi:Bacterial Ig-like domain
MRRIVLLLASIALAVIFGSGVTLADSPTTKEDCKKGGYAKYGFSNQGQCISAVNHATPADTTAPDTIIDSGPEGQTGNDNPSWEFHSTEPNSTFECRLLGFDDWHPCESPRSYVPGQDEEAWGIPHGEYTFQVRAIDAAGNVDPTPAERFVFVDNVGPFAVITSGPDRFTNDTTPTFEFHSSDPADTARFYCRLWTVEEGWSVEENSGQYIDAVPGSNDENCTSPHTFAELPDGHYVAEINAEDAVGNTGGPDRLPQEYPFTVDTTPQSTIDNGPAAVVNGENVTFGFSADQPIKG